MAQGAGKSFVVKSTAQQGLSDLAKAINSISQKNIYIGVIGNNSEHEGELNNAQLMAIHEFGTDDGHVPERAPIRKTMAKNGDGYGTMFEKAIMGVLEGKSDADIILNRIGAQVSGDVVKEIQAGLTPDISDSTKARRIKGDGDEEMKPLIDTGALVQSISYEVK